MAYSNLQTDVVIIGGGGAGIPAAIEVARAGGKAIVLEGAAECGGTAAISGGGCCIVGTPLQKSQGIEDTPDIAFEDWVKWGGGAADEVWASYYLEHTLHDLYHWAESCGAKWVDMKVQEGNRVLRWHRPDNNGLGLMTALDQNRRIDTEHHDHDIDQRGQAAHEQMAASAASRRRETMKPFEIHGKAVVVATGGFNSNLDMVLDQRPEFKEFKVMEGSGFGAKGEGHKMIQGAGRLLHPHGANLVLRLRHAGLSRPEAKTRLGLSHGAGLHLVQPAGKTISQRIAHRRRVGDAGAASAKSAARLGDCRHADAGKDRRCRSLLSPRRRHRPRARSKNC